MRKITKLVVERNKLLEEWEVYHRLLHNHVAGIYVENIGEVEKKAFEIVDRMNEITDIIRGA